jgi:hypothetical protein
MSSIGKLLLENVTAQLEYTQGPWFDHSTEIMVCIYTIME